MDKTLKHIFGTGSETQLSIRTANRLRELGEELRSPELAARFISSPHMAKNSLVDAFSAIFDSVEEADENVDKISKGCSIGLFEQSDHETRIASVPEAPSFQILVRGSYLNRAHILIGLNVGLVNALSTWAQETKEEGDRFIRLLAIGLIEAAMVVYNELSLIAEPGSPEEDLYKGVRAATIFNQLDSVVWTNRGRMRSSGREMAVLNPVVVLRGVHSSFEREPLKQEKFFPSFIGCETNNLEVDIMIHTVPSFIRFMYHGPTTRHYGAWTGEELTYLDILSHGTKGTFVNDKFSVEETFIETPSSSDINRAGSLCLVRVSEFCRDSVKVYRELRFPRDCIKYGDDISLAILKEIEALEEVKKGDNIKLYELMKLARYGNPLENIEALTYEG